MVVTVRLPAILRGLAGDRAALPVEVASPATVQDVLDALAVEFPALDQRIRDERGAIRRHVNVFVGDTGVQRTSVSAALVPEGTEVHVLPSISGGAR